MCTNPGRLKPRYGGTARQGSGNFPRDAAYRRTRLNCCHSARNARCGHSAPTVDERKVNNKAFFRLHSLVGRDTH